MATLQPLPSPLPNANETRLPDYLPARMVNEFVYCPRLFFLEWVEGVFRPSVDTEEGKVQHANVDKPGKRLPKADELTESQADSEADVTIHSRSVTLSSQLLHVT